MVAEREALMPSSNILCAPEVLALCNDVPHARILDVGPGHGKYGVLLREYLAGVRVVDAVEAWEPYVTPRLQAIYDQVLLQDVMTLPPLALAAYDIVLMVDVLEHLGKEDAHALFRRTQARVVICTPRDYFQNHAEVNAGIWTENHRSHWTSEELASLPRCEVAYTNDVLGGVFARLGRAD
jgi:2-polyprenyl-3-methyl-5-hydroxy-6-metoxy-1,4-benzoquinol methylase